jgi:hypothetical protein
MKHGAPTVRGAVVTVTAQCTRRVGRYWEWTVVITDDLSADLSADQQVLGRGTLGFVGDVDVKDYTKRRLRPKLAARTMAVRVWLCVLNALRLFSIMAIPVQVDYLWQHGWISRLATETVLVVGWLVALTGLPTAVRDWFTVHKDESAESGVMLDDHQR